MRCCAMLWVRKEMQNGGEERKGDRHHDIGLGLDVSGGGGGGGGGINLIQGEWGGGGGEKQRC